MNPERLAPRVLGRRVPLPLVGWLTLVWVLLWGDLTVANVLGGLLTSLIITWLLPLPVVDPGIRLRPVAMAAFLLWFAGDTVRSTARVVFYVLRPGPPPTELVRVRLRTSSESMVMLIMVALSSVPGSVVVEAYVVRRELVLHVLGLTGGDVPLRVQDNVTALERRIVAAFGTAEDRRETVR
ncbi:Na+/H+ antiporter subunit E [Nonomuraea sp. NBC_01738]|uniref:Na+/H+ antiporter subunit E n=1 Tax=Nonomuraea sp. NBC_01738 TaxID=2976003 RepID=UPI002E11BBFD|nr:Na+/H+ antiporter subunit E [Nonomuraea sp. NBC_01738]